MAGYSKIWLILILLLQVLISTAGGVGAAYYYYHNKKICPGIEVSGISLEGLDFSGAREKLHRELSQPSMITLHWGESDFSIPLYSGVYEYLIDEAVEKAISIVAPRTGAWIETLNVVRWLPYRQSLEVPLVVSSSYLQKELEALREYIDREPENASFVIEKGTPLYLEDKPGAKLNIAESKRVIDEYLRQGRLEYIPLHVSIILPQVTREHLPDFSECLASYETPLDSENHNRNHNIELAIAALNGWIIEPGQTFSFNEVVGPTTKEKGFLEAPVLQNKQLVPGVGGGICQVATTLYQVALRAELEIVQRSCHSRPVFYVPLGQDATVAYDLLDLKIKNNRDFPIILAGQADESLTFSVFGAEKDPARNIEIVTEEVETIPPSLLEYPDPNLAKGVRQQVQKGEEGYKVKVYRLVYEGEVEKSRELISTDHYLPVNEIVRVGTKEVLQVKK